MGYEIGSGIWGNVFAVPAQITDQHLKLASGLAVKVLLLLLRHGGDLDTGQMASLLGQPVADIQDAVNYWVGQGILAQDGLAPQPVQTAAVPEPPVQQLTPTVQYQQVGPETEDGAKVRKLSSTRQKLTTQEINEMAEQDVNISYLLQETQSVLGKPLTPVATDVVAALYSYYGMQPDLILMLIHYCVSIGKDNWRYIEKVANTWMEQGIDTHEKAEAEICRVTEQNQAEQQVKKAFGIHDRNLITSERNYIHTWMEEYKLDLALVELAYERTVELKGKLSFPYINGILTNWNNKGIKTPAQAVQEIQVNRTSGKAQKKEQGSKQASYDIGELEEMITYGSIV